MKHELPNENHPFGLSPSTTLRRALSKPSAARPSTGSGQSETRAQRVRVMAAAGAVA